MKFRLDSKHRLRYKSTAFKIFHFIGKTLLFLFILFLLLVSFTQTSYFRNLLRDEITRIAQKELNGEIQIGSIYGTLFSSITLKNVDYQIDGVKFISAGTIHISINPLGLFQKKIIVNKIFLEDGDLNIVQFKDGKWIFEKILKHPSPPDTTPSAKFDFDVFLKSLIFNDFNLSFRKNIDSTNFTSKVFYNAINYDDLIISNLDGEISASLRFKSNQYDLNISDLRFKSNINGFNVEDLDWKISLDKKKQLQSRFKLNTTRTALKIDLEMSDLDLSDPDLMTSFENKYFKVLLESNPFDFSDLYSLLPDVDMLKGKLIVNSEVEGSLKNLQVKYFTIQLDSTRLNLTGNLSNLTDIDKFYIKAKIFDSEILMKNISELLPLYSIPDFKPTGKLKIDVNYEGSPLNFKTQLNIRSRQGEVNGYANFNFKRLTPSYNLNLITKELDLNPYLNVDGRLNSILSINGEGFDPEIINTKLFFDAYNSSVMGNRVDSLKLNVIAQSRKFLFDFSAISDTVDLELDGNIDFQNVDEPVYQFDFAGVNLDPSKNLFLNDYKGEMNFSGKLQGRSFDIENMDLNFALKFFESVVNQINIPESNILVKINHSNPQRKSIVLNSDFLDLEVKGKYRIKDLTDVLKNKVESIVEVVKKKVKTFNQEKDTLLVVEKVKPSKKLTRTKPEEEYIEPLDLSYKIDFKQTDLVNVFLKKVKINIDGDLKGFLSNDTSKFIFENTARISDFWVVDVEKSNRIRNLNLRINLESMNRRESEDVLFIQTEIVADKILSGSIIENLSFSMNYNKDLFKYEINSRIDTSLFIRSSGSFDISTEKFQALIDKFTLEYKKYKLTNQGNLIFSFTKDNFSFDQFTLRRKKDKINLYGQLGYTGKQNLNLTFENLELYELVLNFFPNITEEVNGDLSISTTITGDAKSPEILGNFNLKNLAIGEKELGELDGSIDYKNNLLRVNSAYIDSIYEGKDFNLDLSLPVNLSFQDVKERIKKNDKIDFHLNFNNFNLQPLSLLSTIFKNINGSLNGNVQITGTFDKPEFYGSINSSGLDFVLAQNNLRYTSDLKINFDGDRIELEKFELENVGTKKRGRLYTNGEIKIDSRGIKDLVMTVRGNLLVLGNESKPVSPKVYGDLFVQTAQPIVIRGNYNDYTITGEVDILESALIIPPIEQEYSSEEEFFVYRYVDYSPEIDPADAAFLEAERELRGTRKAKTEKKDGVFSKVQGKIKLSLKNNVSMMLIFNQELNQRLFADLKGEVVYNFSGNQTSTQGEIELTQDSYLVFYQKFLASGKIRFESSLSNPYLDVVATYSNYYVQGDTVNQTIKDVVIKLKLIGTVENLGKNLVSNKENIEVSIDGTADPTKDASDVVAFILVGKFKDDLTTEDKTSTISTWGSTFQSAASSLLGSVITNFANSILGDVLRNVEFRKVGEETKFSFEGKVKDLRFKVGGGTDVFQNFALANIQLEYPISEKLFLRIIRKQSQLQVSKPTEMINEVGLKYKVEF